ncbi:MAG: hypothetical protein ACT4OS_02215 [Acidimicrobiales bacterium]
MSSGRHIRVVDPSGSLIDRFDDQTSTVTSLVWSRDGALLGVGCYGGVSWFAVDSNFKAGESTSSSAGSAAPAGRAPTYRYEWKGSILTMTISPDGRWLAAGNQDAPPTFGRCGAGPTWR